MAEAIFRHLSQDNVISAGVAPEARVDENIITVLKEIGIDPGNPQPKKLTESLMQTADKIITFKCSERIPEKYRHKTDDWSIGAGSVSQLQNVYSKKYLRNIRDQIYVNIKKLIEDLKQG